MDELLDLEVPSVALGARTFIHSGRRGLPATGSEVSTSRSRDLRSPALPGSGKSVSRCRFRRVVCGRADPEARTLVGRELLEVEIEDFLERGGACGLTSSTVIARPISRSMVVNAASSSPQAVIHSVNGAGSRSTFSA